MQKEISLFQISKILFKNWKLIFLFTLAFTIISYSLSYTFKEIYGTSIKFFKPEINKDNLNEGSLLEKYLIDTFKKQPKSDSSTETLEDKFDKIFLKNLYFTDYFIDFLNQNEIKEILKNKKNTAEIVANIFSKNFNIKQTFFVDKIKNIPIYELEIIHSKDIIEELALLMPLYIQNLRDLSLMQVLESRYSDLKKYEEILSDNLNITEKLGLDNSLYLSTESFNVANEFLFYEGPKILEQMIRNIDKDKIAFEEIISELKNKNSNNSQDFLIKSISGNMITQSFISPNRLEFTISGFLFGFIFSIFFLLFNKRY